MTTWAPPGEYTPAPKHAAPQSLKPVPPAVIYMNERRDVGMAFVLLLLTGMFGGHRYYLRRKGSAITMTLLAVLLVGFLINPFWVLVDLFLVADITHEENAKVRRRLGWHD